MELYIFGFRSGAQLDQRLTPATRIQSAPSIKVLWSSWCDAVIATADKAGSWTIEYMGNGLPVEHRTSLSEDQNLRNALSQHDSMVKLFGSTMHQGLRGYMTTIPGTEMPGKRILLFKEDDDTQRGSLEVYNHAKCVDYDLVDMQYLSGGEVLLGERLCSADEGRVLRIKCQQQLQRYLHSRRQPPAMQPPVADFWPAQWCSNATTSTALDVSGRVHTFTCDPRFPKCLGRPSEGASSFQMVPYLSETKISRIASGGYMTAAVSTQGELFLWGQACPGATEELHVLTDPGIPSQRDTNIPRGEHICLDGAQDDYVKCLNVRIDGAEATVYDVAIGHGHILVAAEVLAVGKKPVLAVFAAGDNSRNQLSLDAASPFVKSFQEVAMLRGKRVVHLSAVGWSSTIVTAEKN
ncbi:hypothetical protein ACN47E_010002 [Coniothyrium glycines]